MDELARLLQIIGFLIVIGGAVIWMHIRQRKALAKHTNILTDSTPTLIAVVSVNCAVCPAQKKILERLRIFYPSSILRIEMINLESEPQRVNELRVMTIPTTLVVAADGTICHINNGLASFEKIKSQIKQSLTL